MLVMLPLWYHFTYVHPMLNGCNDNKKSDVRILHLQILRQQNKRQILEFQALNNQKTVALVLQEKKGNLVVMEWCQR